MNLSFSKYSGSGNDFILIDNRFLQFPIANSAFIARLCNRQQGIGADGLILLETSQKADYRMRIFNADGGEAEMCGNGIRCLTKFIRELGEIETSYRIETMHAVLRVDDKGTAVSVQMPQPSDIQWEIRLPNLLPLHRLNTGVPHAVFFVEDLENKKWMTLAPSIRFHPIFGPQGTNVNFACIDEKGALRLRTYERGVEGETLACGTGATATAIAAAKYLGLTSPVTIFPRSNEPLEITFSWVGETPVEVFMAGPAHLIYNGFIK